MPAKAVTGKIGDWHELECLSESAICIRAMCDEASDELAGNEKADCLGERKRAEYHRHEAGDNTDERSGRK